MNKEYLFAYGTLRVGFGLALMRQLEGRIRHAGGGQIKASLYDLGAYPGIVKADRASEVSGDLFEIDEPVKVFEILDDYEGEEFRRELTPVVFRSGEVQNAWVYWYQGPTDKALLIDESDYLYYLKNKKDRFV